MEIEHLTELDPEVDKRLRNRSSDSFRRARKTKPPAVHWLLIRGADGTVNAGCRAESWQGWLNIQALWVDPAERGKGHGAQLLAKTEALARAQGAKGMEVTLYAAEAAGFFTKHGYVVLARIPGEDGEMEKLWLVNSFQPIATAQAKPNARRVKREARKTGTTASKKKKAQ